MRRRRSIRFFGALGVLLVATAIGLPLARVLSDQSTAAVPRNLLQAAPTAGEARAAMFRQLLRRLRLPALRQEGTRLHFHVHLDVFVDGHPALVPAGIGIDLPDGLIAPIHTHDTSGIIHVESPTLRPFTLGQFFGLWGVRLTRHCLGDACAGSGRELRVYVDGRAVASDPTRLILRPHHEIVVAFGLPGALPKPIPSAYRFPPGE